MSASVPLKQTVSRRTDVVLHMAQYCLMFAALVFSMGFINPVSGKSASASEYGRPAVVETADASTAAESSAPADSALSEPVAAQPADVAEATTPAESLPKHMNGALSYVAQRYKVSAEAVRPIFEAAHQVGREKSIDPLLIVAMIGIESSFNPLAESSFGAQGLMQVVPRFHQDKVPQGAGSEAFFDPATNIRIGAMVLKEAIQRRGGLTAGLQQYAGLTNGERWYVDKVMAEKARLEQAIQRGNKQSAQSAT